LIINPDSVELEVKTTSSRFVVMQTRCKEGEMMNRFFAATVSMVAFAGGKLYLKSIVLGVFTIRILVLQGCSTTPRRLPAVPREVTGRAEIPGMRGVRYVAGVDAPELTQAAFDALKREKDYLKQQGRNGPMPQAVFLAISGGGDNGAFAASLLNAWTEAGTRPEFKLVTGISTGALIAPFAFLGPKYDATLKEVYTTITPKDVLEPRSLLGGALSDTMADNAPLAKRDSHESSTSQMACRQR
jgi:hypothetical protein